MNTIVTERAAMRCVVACSLVIGLAACGTAAEPESRGSDAPKTLSAASEGAGFIHTANNSRFRLGANPSPRLEFGLAKLVGSEGVFATVPETGWVLAVPNANAPSTQADPLTRSADAHNKAVVDYFVGAGLPADQIERVNAHASVWGSASDATSGRLTNGEFAGYSSVISRVVAGVSVPDSFAWARFNTNGEVVEEQVYWPAIPSGVVQEARALSAAVSDPAQFAVIAGKLPANFGDGRVVIRHSAGSERSPFECVASYDMVRPGEMGGVRHFDRRGVEFKMASDGQAAITPAVQRTR